MAYSDFNLSRVAERFGLAIAERDLYRDTPELAASPLLQGVLDRYRPLARAIGTEKARSEFLIAPILAEVRYRLDDQVSLFSGIDLPAAPEQGLNGVCDFLFSRSPQQLFLTRPIIAVVEAKNENLATGFGQCIAEMIGARIFNQNKQVTEPVMFGVVTTGTLWRFLRMEADIVEMDDPEYPVEQTNKILGILHAMLGPAGRPIDAGSPGGPGTTKGQR